MLAEEVNTARTASKIILSSDHQTLKSDGNDLSFITVEVTDENGNLVPDADQLIDFKIEGEGAIVGVDNGDPVSHESFKAPRRKAFHGKCLVVVQSGEKSGSLKLTATSPDLTTDGVELIVN